MRCWKCGANQDENLDKEIRKAVLRCLELIRESSKDDYEDGPSDMIRKEFNLKVKE